MPLPCTHFKPASMTDHFELSTMIGTRAISGSAASRFRNFVITASPSSRASSKLTSSTFAPLSTWPRATLRPSSNLSSLMSRANFLLPVTLVRSPIMMKFDSGRMRERFQAAEPGERFDRRAFARRGIGHRFGNRFDVRRRGAAAAADDVQPTVAGKFAEQPGHRLRGFVEAAQRIWQAGVGIATDVNRRDVGKLFDVGPHLLGPKAQLMPMLSRFDMRQRIPTGFDRLAPTACGHL